MSDKRWYKDMVFYQIWPRSFCDGNGDGVGDLEGVLSKLDYIESLGVTGIWFSPLYPSPNADYGYDVSDYRGINPEFGDMRTFERVLAEAHARGLKVIMDLVINHTSIEHEWFRASRDANSPYHDYYFWRKGAGPRRPPNNWDSLFQGKAWEYDPNLNEYYLHLFAKGQADLNHDNPAVRNEVKDIMRFWLDKGVDGFREDVITLISKPEGLPNDYLRFGSRGYRLYREGPHIHDYLREFRHDVLDRYDCMVVGETPLMGPHRSHAFLAEGPNQELDLLFHFQHMEADCASDEYEPRPFDLRKLKRAFSSWEAQTGTDTWDTLFMENHDRPRVISRYGSEAYRTESGKMLAVCYLFQQGTPFVYQGQEIGMTNIRLDSIDEYKDVLARNNYAVLVRDHTPAEALEVIHRASRDSARTPMQWSAAPNAGFSTLEPWFGVNPNYVEVNVAAEEADPDSLLNFYRRAIELRKSLPVVRNGAYREFYPHDRNLYVYERTSDDGRLLVICSFSEKPVAFDVPGGYNLRGVEPILCNYATWPMGKDGYTTRPYETRVYLLR